jgi:response regulator RpfG family c-di-GMP phosphodiesterase
MMSFLSGWRKHALPVPDEQEAAGALVSSLLLMAWFVEARDPYTGGHLWRVSRYSRLLRISEHRDRPFRLIVTAHFANA